MREDILSFMNDNGLREEHAKVGNFYSTQEHDSIRIDSGRRLWTWNSKEIGGYGVFNWMEKIESQGFNPTMEKLLGKSPDTAEIYEPQNIIKKGSDRKYFNGSAPAKFYDRQYKAVTNYLTDKRCISADIVTELMKQGKIYQDTRYNAVFANLDENGEVGFWCLRGTHLEKKFTRNMPGSNNPYYGFAVDAKIECDILYVFEATIDLLSHCTIANLKYGEGSWHNQHRIALCGVNDTALKHYLSKHKNIHTIKFCLDNDDTGKNATQTLMAKYYELGYKTQSINYIAPGKDINEILCNYINKTKQKISTPPRKAEENQTAEKTTSKEKTPEEKAQAAAPAQSNYVYDRSYMGVYLWTERKLKKTLTRMLFIKILNI